MERTGLNDDSWSFHLKQFLWTAGDLNIMKDLVWLWNVGWKWSNKCQFNQCFTVLHKPRVVSPRARVTFSSVRAAFFSGVALQGLPASDRTSLWVELKALGQWPVAEQRVSRAEYEFCASCIWAVCLLTWSYLIRLSESSHLIHRSKYCSHYIYSPQHYIVEIIKKYLKIIIKMQHS